MDEVGLLVISSSEIISNTLCVLTSSGLKLYNAAMSAGPETIIEHRADNEDPNQPTFIARREGAEHGWLYVYRAENSKIWELDWVATDDPGHGIRHQLLDAFRQQVGSGVPVSGLLTHDVSSETMKEMGFFDRLVGEPEIEVTAPDHLQNIPFVELLEKAGIHINRLSLRRSPEPVNGPSIRFYGVTE